MNTIISSVSLILIVLFTGCAGIHKDIDAIKKVDGNNTNRLFISADLNNDLSSEYFGMLEFTFENTTDKWVTIDHIDVKAKDESFNKTMKFTTGEDFVVWSKAIRKRNKVDKYNKALVYSAIIGVAAATTALSKNNNVKNAAAGVWGLGLTSLTIDQIEDAKNNVEDVDLFPANHLLNGHIRVPPGLFTERWLLINTTDHDTTKLLYALELEIHYADKKMDKYYVPIFKSYREMGRRAWQRQIQNNIKKERRLKM